MRVRELSGLAFSAGIYQTVPIADVIRLTRLAEALGFHAAWFGDSQCLWRDAHVTLGAAAVSTSRLRLGTSVTNPLTRHLTVTAAAMYSLAELTGDRVLMGIGRGETSVILVGERRATLPELEEAVRTIRALWAGQEVKINGGEAHLAYAVAAPKTIPIYLPGSGPLMLALAGRIADGVLLTVGADPRYIRAALAHVAEGARAAGRSLGEIRVAARIPCSVSDDRDARNHVRSHVAITALQAKPFEMDPEDLPAVEQIRRAYEYRQHLALDASHADLVPDSLVDKFALAGRPDECLERVRALAESGIDELNLVLMSPDPDSLLRSVAGRIIERL